MCLMRFSAALLFASLAVVPPLLVAQPKVCMGGDLDHLNPAQAAACSSVVKAVRTQSAAIAAPEDWHIVVVCGQEGWQQYASFAHTGSASEVLNSKIDTDVTEHATFLNAAAMDAQELPALLETAAASMESSAMPSEVADAR